MKAPNFLSALLFIGASALCTDAVAQISTSGTINAFSSCYGSPSTSQSFSYAANGGSGNVAVSAPSGFEVSFSANLGYSTALSTASTSATVYIRLASSAVGTPSGNVTISRTGLTPLAIPVSGSVLAGYPDGNTLAFDGVNDYVSVSGSAKTTNLDGSQSMTIEAWVYPTAWKTNYWDGPIVDNTDGGNGNYALRVGNGGTIGFTIANSWSNESVVSNSGALALNQWQHVVGTYNHVTNVMSIYVNGILVASLTRTQTGWNTPINPSGTLYIGSTNGWGGRYFPGRIDELRIWNRVLSAAEIQAGMYTGLAGSENNLMGYYKFDQGTASGANTSITSLTNSATNSTGANGTLNNFALTSSNTTSNWVASQGHSVLGNSTLCAGGTSSAYTTTASGGTWSTSNTSIATVDASGNVTPVSAGTVTIQYSYTSGSCTLQATKSITVTAGPTISTVTNGSRCGSGTVSLSATASSPTATLNWYADNVTSTVSGTGTSFTTSSLSASGTYYVSASESGCASGRSAVTATVNPALPTVTTFNGSQCGTGSTYVRAYATNTATGDIKWYTAATGGTLITGTIDSSPNSWAPIAFSAGEVGTTKTIYVEAQNACGTTTRQSVTATSFAIPNTPTASSATRCGAGTVTLSATPDANMAIRWFTNNSDYTSANAAGTGTSFTTPSISSNTTYYARAYNPLSEPDLVCGSAPVAVNATINTTATWTGDGSWSDAANWNCGSNSVPSGSEGITVSSGTLYLNSDITLAATKTMSVSSGANVVIPANYALTIESGATLSNEGQVVADADANGYGQLVLKGTYTKVGNGLVTVKRTYSVSSASSNEKWVQLSSPVNADYSTLGSVASNNLFYWDASVSNWVSAADNGSAFDGTKGYTAYYGPNGIATSTSGTISVSGSPFTSVSAPTLHNHSGTGAGAFNSWMPGSQKAGWNLVGNPLTCNLDFSALNRTNVENAFYRWDPIKGGTGIGGYQAHSSASASPNSTSVVIPPMTAVWVRANGAPVLNNGNINASSHGHKGPKSFKTTPDKFLVTITDLVHSTIIDDLSLAMVSGASDAFEPEWDAWELLNSTQMPNMYANFNNEWTTAKAVDFDLNSTVVKVIPVSVKASMEMRPYRIHLDESWAQPGYTVYLKDKLLVNTHKLSTSDYVFAYTSAMEDRFELILTNAKTGALGLEEASRGALSAWVDGSELWINGLEAGNAEIDVVGMDGRVVAQQVVRAEEGQPSAVAIPALPAGLYTVRVRSNGLERGVRVAVQR